MARDKQLSLIDLEPTWKDAWRGMPEYIGEDQSPFETVYIHFKSAEDRRDFEKLIGQKIIRYAGGPGSVWFPKAEVRSYAGKSYKNKAPVNLRYLVYIISKGRWESRLTSKSLEKIGVPYRIVIEPQEYDSYAAVINPEKILTLPFSNLGQGGIPARNWVWEHSISAGAERHWILDDNIDGFYRYNRNLKTPVGDGTIFQAAEDFVDRYENVALAGFNYFMFIKNMDGDKQPPFYLNTRIYSCILIKNNIPYRWRGRYNEDADLSIRALKDGWATILFNAFLARKAQTMTIKGGNTESLYKLGEGKDGRLLMAESLRDQHPDIVKIVWKWDRWQHDVDYHIFDGNKLTLKPGVNIPDGIDNFGMELEVKEKI